MLLVRRARGSTGYGPSSVHEKRSADGRFGRAQLGAGGLGERCALPLPSGALGAPRSSAVPCELDDAAASVAASDLAPPAPRPAISLGSDTRSRPATRYLLEPFRLAVCAQTSRRAACSALPQSGLAARVPAEHHHAVRRLLAQYDDSPARVRWRMTCGRTTRGGPSRG